MRIYIRIWSSLVVAAAMLCLASLVPLVADAGEGPVDADPPTVPFEVGLGDSPEGTTVVAHGDCGLLGVAGDVATVELTAPDGFVTHRAEVDVAAAGTWTASLLLDEAVPDSAGRVRVAARCGSERFAAQHLTVTPTALPAQPIAAVAGLAG